MTLHMIKLCVGATSVDDLTRWQARFAMKKWQGRRAAYHTTFQSPKRQDDLLDGGSLYWVIKGTILARQRLLGFEDGRKEDGSACCLLMLDPAVFHVRPTPRRAFQGWRYLTADDAPKDVKRGARDDVAVMPTDMRKRLADLGLL
jgi:hypothetical protein